MRGVWWLALALSAIAACGGDEASETAGDASSDATMADAGPRDAATSNDAVARDASSTDAALVDAASADGSSDSSVDASTPRDAGVDAAVINDAAVDAAMVTDASCGPACSLLSEMCCQGQCVATYNDPHNCGGCGNQCMGATPFCDNGNCAPPPVCMAPAPGCNGGTCCGTFCCTAGQICCNVESNLPMMNPQCVDPVNGTCPIGCPGCP
jgi:hypothetical protein